MLNIHRQQLRYSEKKWFCMLSVCTSACIMQHHTTSCNMRSEVKTYEDPNSRIVLAPHEPIFLRTHDKTWQNNANLSNIFDKKTNSIRQEKFNREHVDLVRNVQRQDISTNFDNGIGVVCCGYSPFYTCRSNFCRAPPADLSWPFCRIDVGVLMVFCVFVRDVCKSKIKATRLIFLKDFWCLHEWRFVCLRWLVPWQEFEQIQRHRGNV